MLLMALQAGKPPMVCMRMICVALWTPGWQFLLAASRADLIFQKMTIETNDRRIKRVVYLYSNTPSPQESQKYLYVQIHQHLPVRVLFEP